MNTQNFKEGNNINGVKLNLQPSQEMEHHSHKRDSS